MATSKLPSCWGAASAAPAPKHAQLRLVRPVDDAVTSTSGRAKLALAALERMPPEFDGFKTVPAPESEDAWRARHNQVAVEYLQRLFALINRCIGDRHDASGLATDVLLEYFAWERKTAAVTGRVPAGPWPMLSSIAKRRCIDWRRRKARHGEPLDDETFLDLSVNLPAQDHREVWMIEALQAFACEHKICPDVLWARYAEDKTMKEIGIEFERADEKKAADRGRFLIDRAKKCFRAFLESWRAGR